MSRPLAAVAVVAGACADPGVRTPSPASAPPSSAPSAQPSAVARPPREAAALQWRAVDPPLPQALSNNAVAAVGGAEITLVSLMGLAAGKTHADITRSTWVGQPGGPWRRGADVPGTVGRLASAAVTVDGEAWLFGGYTVAPDGHEVSLPQIDIYDPEADRWRQGPTMPTPVDDAVIVRWRDRIGLVSGWSNTDNVRDVQWLDLADGTWSAATPMPAPGVFGHAGGVLDDTVVVCDGVRTTAATPRYAAVDRCLVGTIDPQRPEAIAWRVVPSHPGPARYRIAAGTFRPPHASRAWVVFAGGTATPYNYDGIGYDGVPATPVRDVFAWDGEAWRTLPPLPAPSMDHRALVAAGDALFLIGGLDEARQPVDRILRLGPP